MTIYDIKRIVDGTGSHFFARDSMKFFHQTLKMFKVSRCDDGRYFLTCPRYDWNGVRRGNTEIHFNPANNELEHN